jgi:hypothetical protein
MFNLKHASSAIKKVVYQSGIRAGLYEPVSPADKNDDNAIIARVYDNKSKMVEVRVGDIKYIEENEIRWSDIK